MVHTSNAVCKGLNEILRCRATTLPCKQMAERFPSTSAPPGDAVPTAGGVGEAGNRDPVFLLMATGQIESAEVKKRGLVSYREEGYTCTVGVVTTPGGIWACCVLLL